MVANDWVKREIVFNKQEAEILYKFLAYEYIPYENADMIALMKKLREFVNNDD